MRICMTCVSTNEWPLNYDPVRIQQLMDDIGQGNNTFHTQDYKMSYTSQVQDTFVDYS